MGGVQVCNSVDRREGVSDDYDGGRLRKWSRKDSFKTMEVARSSVMKIEAEFRSLKLYIVLSTEN